MKKRTYGTGSYVPRGDGKWRLFYKPKWSSKPLSKTVEAANEKAVSRLLSDWVTELDKQSGPSVSVSIDQIVELHLADMRRKGRCASSIAVVEQRCNKHLIPYFSGIDFASPVKRAIIDKYVDTRLQAGAKRATVNRELSALRRAIRLGIEGELITVAPPRIEQLDENNTRTGFVDETAYSAILQKLPEHQQMLWCFAYRLGIRKGELLKLLGSGYFRTGMNRSHSSRCQASMHRETALRRAGSPTRYRSTIQNFGRSWKWH